MYAIGVDLGGTNIVVGLVDDTGAILRKRSSPTHPNRSNEAVIDDIAKLCVEAADPVGGMDGVMSVGVGVPGIVNPKKGYIDLAVNIGFKEVNLRALFAPHFDTPVYVENDANCAAFGESISGAARDYDHSLTITLAAGIGAGVIIHRRIYRGAFYGAGEIGHGVIRMGGEQCACGRKGCWEAYASPASLTRDARRLAEREPNGGLAKLVEGDITRVNSRIAFEAADAGDPGARALIDDYIEYLVEGLANAANAFQPSVIVLGGNLSHRDAAFFDLLSEKTSEHAIATCKNVRVVPGELGNDAGVVGAAMLTGC